MNTQEQAVISEAVIAMDALIILGEQNVPPPYKPLKERHARDRLKALLAHAPTTEASAQLAAAQAEVGRLKELREGDNHLIRGLAEDVGIKITASDKLLGVQWEQFHDGVLTLRRERDELKDRLVEAALSLGHFDLGYYSLQSKALSLVRTGRPFSGSQSAVLTSVLEELKTAAEAKSPEWPARAKQGEGQP